MRCSVSVYRSRELRRLAADESSSIKAWVGLICASPTNAYFFGAGTKMGVPKYIMPVNWFCTMKMIGTGSPENPA
jgi:hypothetical protein